MDRARFDDANVVIIEGIPGSGKTTLQEILRVAARGRQVTVFPEEALLFGWIHAWIPGIEKLRMALMQQLMDHLEASLTRNADQVFILSRFHISYLLFTEKPDREAYDTLVERLRALKLLVMVPQLPAPLIAGRVAHVERDDPAWRTHLARRLAMSGFEDLGAMYDHEQCVVRRLLVEQQLPHEIIDSTDLASLELS